MVSERVARHQYEMVFVLSLGHQGVAEIFAVTVLDCSIVRLTVSCRAMDTSLKSKRYWEIVVWEFSYAADYLFEFHASRCRANAFFPALSYSSASCPLLNQGESCCFDVGSVVGACFAGDNGLKKGAAALGSDLVCASGQILRPEDPCSLKVAADVQVALPAVLEVGYGDC